MKSERKLGPAFGILALLVLAAGLTLWALSSSGEPEVLLNVEWLGEETPTSEPERVTPPPLRHYFQEGDVLKYTGHGADFCPNPAGDRTCYPGVDLKQGDRVVVLDSEPLLVSENYYAGWWWRVKGCNGGVHVVDEISWVSDEESWRITDECGEPRRPDIDVGDRVLLNYGYYLRESPAGPVKIGNLGIRITVLGGTKVEVLEGPTLDREGKHYWCRVKILDGDYEGDQGWVPCEFQFE
jgi:hypothetical protein